MYPIFRTFGLGWDFESGGMEGLWVYSTRRRRRRRLVSVDWCACVCVLPTLPLLQRALPDDRDDHVLIQLAAVPL